MYYFNYVKSLFYKRNISVLFYQILNLVLVFFGFYFFNFSWFNNRILSGVAGIGVYLIGQIIAFSFVGEWMMRVIYCCKSLDRLENGARMQELFDEVLSNAIEKGYKLPKDVKLYVKFDNVLNAFACGKKTVVMHNILAECDEDVIKAVFAHELGHIINSDSFKLQSVKVGNIVVSLMFLIYRFVGSLVVKFFTIFGVTISRGAYFVINVVILGLIMYIWDLIGVLLVTFSMRKCEIIADNIAKDLGYQEGLERLLNWANEGEVKNMSLFEKMTSTHPVVQKRLENLA